MDFWLDVEGIDQALPTIESIKRFVQMGMGVAIVPRMRPTISVDFSER
jgi:DNA-binding transcriptional LysR family regulator